MVWRTQVMWEKSEKFGAGIAIADAFTRNENENGADSSWFHTVFNAQYALYLNKYKSGESCVRSTKETGSATQEE